MKKLHLVFAALLLAGTGTTAAAQEPPGAPGAQGGQRRAGGQGAMMARMMEGITLTAEQQAKVDSISKAFAEQRQSMMSGDMDRETRMAKNRELMTKQSDALKAVLTDEQKKVFEKNVADMQAQRRQGGGRPPR